MESGCVTFRADGARNDGNLVRRMQKHSGAREMAPRALRQPPGLPRAWEGGRRPLGYCDSRGVCHGRPVWAARVAPADVPTDLSTSDAVIEMIQLRVDKQDLFQ